MYCVNLPPAITIQRPKGDSTHHYCIEKELRGPIARDQVYIYTYRIDSTRSRYSRAGVLIFVALQ